MKIFEGTVTSAQGFQASGITAGLKKSGNPDLALIYSETPCVAAAAYTQNTFAAAPVNQCRQAIDSQDHYGIVVNSGIANACTGEQGEKDAAIMAEFTASQLSKKAGKTIRSSELFISSTGRIGDMLPMDIITSGIEKAATVLHSNGGIDAAKAIMTTDTVPKYLAVEIELDGKKVTIGGMTKGAGMINPEMKGKHATMLAYLTTDANVDKQFLQYCLDETLDESFNKITIDGDTSTNDTYIAMANGLAQNELLSYNLRESENGKLFLEAMKKVSAELARKMVLDGEGATRFVHINITSATDKAEAKQCAEAIANSLLCKTAWFGSDPNWGRILDAAGYSGAKINTSKVTLCYGDLPIVVNGLNAGTDENAQFQAIDKPEFHINLDLGIADGAYTVWTSDLSYEYVKINADYHT